MVSRIPQGFSPGSPSDMTSTMLRQLAANGWIQRADGTWYNTRTGQTSSGVAATMYAPQVSATFRPAPSATINQTSTGAKSTSNAGQQIRQSQSGGSSVIPTQNRAPSGGNTAIVAPATMPTTGVTGTTGTTGATGSSVDNVSNDAEGFASQYRAGTYMDLINNPGGIAESVLSGMGVPQTSTLAGIMGQENQPIADLVSYLIAGAGANQYEDWQLVNDIAGLMQARATPGGGGSLDPTALFSALANPASPEMAGMIGMGSGLTPDQQMALFQSVLGPMIDLALSPMMGRALAMQMANLQDRYSSYAATDPNPVDFAEWAFLNSPFLAAIANPGR